MGDAPESPLRAWLDAAPGTGLTAVWDPGGASLETAFRSFYGLLLRHMRVDSREALAALDRVSLEDRRRLAAIDRLKLLRLRAHTLMIDGRYLQAHRIYERAWSGFEKLRAAPEIVSTGIGWINCLGQLSLFGRAMEIAVAVRRHIPVKDRLQRARLDSNIGNTLTLQGRYREAAARFLTARRVLVAEGYLNDAALCTYNLGYVQLLTGDLESARTLFREAEVHFRTAGFLPQAVYCSALLAVADLVGGSWSEALPRLDDVIEELRQAGDVRARLYLERQEAEFLAALGALEKAEALARDSYDGYRDLGLRSDAAHAACLHARILAALGRNMDARVRLEAALGQWRASGDRRSEARTLLELGAVFLARGSVNEALEQLRKAAPYLYRHDRLVGAPRCRHLMAEAEGRRGRHRAAARLARRAFDEAVSFPVSLERPWIAMTLARSLVRGGERAGSVRWARRSIDEMEKVYLSLGSPALRGQASASRERIYRGVVEIVQSRGGRDAARISLDLLGRARAPQMLEDMIRETGVRRPGLSALVARLRDEMLGPGQGGGDGARAAAVARQVAELSRAMNRVVPSRAASRAFSRRTFPAWSRRLRDRSLVYYDRSGDEWSAFVVAGGAVRKVPLTGAAQALRERWVPLRILLEHAAHREPDQRAAFLRATREEAQEALERLAVAFWSPLDVSPGRVVVVTSGDLHGVPVECLAETRCPPDSAPRWIATRLPHPALLSHPRRRAAPEALLLHDRERFRHREAAEIAAVLRGLDIPVAEVTTRKEFMDFRRPVHLLHVAAHGSYHRSRWMLNGIRLEDGWLGFEHLKESRLRNALLVFETCESGLTGRVPGTDLDGWQTVGLGAGAREMILTLWKIDDASAAAFARAFYPLWIRGVPAGEASMKARHALRRAEPHPFAWAPFLAVG